MFIIYEIMGGFSVDTFIMSKLTQETNGDPECGI